MKSQDWQRARTEEQVEQRVREIQDAAARLMQTLPYEKVTLLQIAKDLDFTRSNVYRYFSTKEEIFLSIYVADMQRWREDIEREFTGPLGIEMFADKWTEILCRQERLLELSSLLAVTLERNTSEEAFRKTKLFLGELLMWLVSILRTVLPMLSDDQIVEFARTQQVLFSGAWPMSRLPERQKEILREMNSEYMILDFPVFYRDTILRILKSLAEENLPD
jgi:AcrR family transcriptional regulator